MKRIISLIAVGIAYVIFVVAFSFFNNNVTSAEVGGIAHVDNQLSADPGPPPPGPPPPPPGP